jgi:hypothetical protein
LGTINSASSLISATYAATGPGQTLIYNVTTSVYNTNTQAYDFYSGLTNFAVTQSMSGGFSATLKNSYPNQVFSSTGQTTVYLTTVVGTVTNNTGNTIIQTTNSSKIYVNTVQGSRYSN